ncbi:MAG TPA: hypothetical protein VGK09_04520 [Rhodocyclaceae bacterium]|jgi:hypothetical protein
MEKLIFGDVVVVLLGSFISFAFPALATLLGEHHAGFAGATLAWLASSLIVVLFFFPTFGRWVDAALRSSGNFVKAQPLSQLDG